ncbi:LLM class flavin-dependent oxidoreductase [Streptomyces flavotricini]|uniref:LLM class flavin-dependent oxidoreductase n=1 Tax=Streptomyces flavotricini TaxID=66888 RepID=A0ABS8EH27_9ACTN|nr:LLM class flavin-dependent oxidoreductase [Streptomyces flavotricini]MCC0100249.1 LLM class flavin-dependent oxidoreductase [Streptomyces flavotricini]
MQLGVNVPNFGPGTTPGVLSEWARIVEGLGFDLLMVSDHVAVTPDVAARYPAPFHEPFTTLSWLAGMTTRVRLGTTVLVLPYRHPLLVARMAANLNALSGGRLVLGVGVGWARQEFEALGVPFSARGRLTDEHLVALREAWSEEDDGHTAPIPVWVGGNSEAGIRRAIEFGDAWHPLRGTLPWMRSVVTDHSLPGFAPRITLKLTTAPVGDPERLAGTGTLEQILDDLDQLERLGADTVVLDPYHGDPQETRRPHEAWQALTAVATRRRTSS